MNATSKVNIYKKAFGEKHPVLTPVLKKVHGDTSPIFAKGTVTVEYMDYWLTNLVKPFIPLPAAGQYPLELHITKKDKGEDWIRKFGDKKMNTYQYFKRGYLLERLGPFTFAFELDCNRTSMTFNFVRLYFLGIPIPRFMSPRIHAKAHAIDLSSWKIVVFILYSDHRLASYFGKMKLIETPQQEK